MTFAIVVASTTAGRRLQRLASEKCPLAEDRSGKRCLPAAVVSSTRSLPADCPRADPIRGRGAKAKPCLGSGIGLVRSQPVLESWPVSGSPPPIRGTCREVSEHGQIYSLLIGCDDCAVRIIVLVIGVIEGELVGVAATDDSKLFR